MVASWSYSQWAASNSQSETSRSAAVCVSAYNQMQRQLREHIYSSAHSGPSYPKRLAPSDVIVPASRKIRLSADQLFPCCDSHDASYNTCERTTIKKKLVIELVVSKPNHVDRLPVEVLTRILGLVPHTDAIKSCSLVSKKWHAAAKLCMLPQITLPKDFATDPRKLEALVRGWPNVRRLSFPRNTVVRNLTGLAACRPLRKLSLYHCQVRSLEGIQGCSMLESLNLHGAIDITDIRPLYDLSYLTTLILSHTGIEDLSGLGNLVNLEILVLGNTRVEDIGSLSECLRLCEVVLSNTLVADVSALAKLQHLHTLDLRSTRVVDVAALSNCRALATLDLSNTAVCEVVGLAILPRLQSLYLGGSGAKDSELLLARSISVQMTQMPDFRIWEVRREFS